MKLEETTVAKSNNILYGTFLLSIQIYTPHIFSAQNVL